ncbi:MAG: hypothetical protein H0W78_05260 [Planctomycetes bacterium]|jgi:hypothetical protein|nr:hypothetical protein [Planctomycetota bacterium]
MRAVPTLLATLILTVGLTGCGNQQTKRDPVAEKTAAGKVQAAIAAQRTEEEKHRAELRAAATEGKLSSINSVCPVTGEPVDPAITPVTVEILVVSPPDILAIGVANEAAAAAVRSFPDRYAPAAKQNRQARSATTVGY